MPFTGISGGTLASDRRSGLTRYMDYRLVIGDEALAQLRALRKEQRRRIGQRIDALQHGLQGDVLKLAGQSGKYRLRVGDYRILFTLEKDQIFVHQVKDRKNAYRE